VLVPPPMVPVPDEGAETWPSSPGDVMEVSPPPHDINNIANDEQNKLLSIFFTLMTLVLINCT
jgi:hypothetical protein